MIERALDQILRLGGERRGRGEAVWQDQLVQLNVHRNGVAELRVELPPNPEHSWRRALHANPEVGWTYALSERGRLQRRDVLVAGVPAGGRAAEQQRLVRIWNAIPSPPDPVSALAAVAYLLRRNALGLDGCRHRLDGLELDSVWRSVLVGRNLQARGPRNREEASVVRALRQRADAGSALLAQLSLSID